MFFILLTVSSFILNLIWEYAQCAPFFIHNAGAPTHFDMFIASVGDVFLTWLGYFFVFIISKDHSWVLKKWDSKVWISIICSALLLSISIEIWALKTSRWAYTEINPIIFDKVSIIPILQLLLLFPFSFFLSRKLMPKE